VGLEGGAKNQSPAGWFDFDRIDLGKKKDEAGGQRVGMD
jgi:hypothetical protein